MEGTFHPPVLLPNGALRYTVHDDAHDDADDDNGASLFAVGTRFRWWPRAGEVAIKRFVDLCMEDPVEIHYDEDTRLLTCYSFGPNQFESMGKLCVPGGTPVSLWVDLGGHRVRWETQDGSALELSLPVNFCDSGTLAAAPVFIAMDVNDFLDVGSEGVSGSTPPPTVAPFGGSILTQGVYELSAISPTYGSNGSRLTHPGEGEQGLLLGAHIGTRRGVLGGANFAFRFWPLEGQVVSALQYEPTRAVSHPTTLACVTYRDGAFHTDDPWGEHLDLVEIIDTEGTEGVALNPSHVVKCVINDATRTFQIWQGPLCFYEAMLYEYRPVATHFFHICAGADRIIDIVNEGEADLVWLLVRWRTLARAGRGRATSSVLDWLLTTAPHWVLVLVARALANTVLQALPEAVEEE